VKSFRFRISFTVPLDVQNQMRTDALYCIYEIVFVFGIETYEPQKLEIPKEKTRPRKGARNFHTGCKRHKSDSNASGWDNGSREYGKYEQEKGNTPNS
jgi:hypothetical protein